MRLGQLWCRSACVYALPCYSRSNNYDSLGHDPSFIRQFYLLCWCLWYLSQRRWKNDPQMAIRDCHRALKSNPSSSRALICMAEALSMVTQMTLEFYNSTILWFINPIILEPFQMCCSYIQWAISPSNMEGCYQISSCFPLCDKMKHGLWILKWMFSMCNADNDNLVMCDL